MKILKNKCLNKKLILVLLVVMFLYVIFPNVSHAGIASAIGGKLIQPVCDLLLALGDGTMTVMQKAIIETGGDISVDLTGKTGVIANILGVIIICNKDVLANDVIRGFYFYETEKKRFFYYNFAAFDIVGFYCDGISCI